MSSGASRAGGAARGLVGLVRVVFGGGFAVIEAGNRLQGLLLLDFRDGVPEPHLKGSAFVASEGSSCGHKIPPAGNVSALMQSNAEFFVGTPKFFGMVGTEFRTCFSDFKFASVLTSVEATPIRLVREDILRAFQEIALLGKPESKLGLAQGADKPAQYK